MVGWLTRPEPAVTGSAVRAVRQAVWAVRRAVRVVRRAVWVVRPAVRAAGRADMRCVNIIVNIYSNICIALESSLFEALFGANALFQFYFLFNCTFKM